MKKKVSRRLAIPLILGFEGVRVAGKNQERKTKVP
jgi:hypothetical protein